MNTALRTLVRTRAGDRCEYCRLPQAAVPFTSFHVEHVRAKQHGGDDAESNLALACDRCNLFKGPNLTAVDPQTDQIVRLFHPRIDRWDAHFAFRGPEIVPLTEVGRATAELLEMNAVTRLELRSERIVETGRPD